MSTQKSDIIIVGIKFNYKDFEKLAKSKIGDDYYDEIVDPFYYRNLESSFSNNMNGDLKCIFDGMNGQYVIYGLPIMIAYENNGFDEIFSFDEHNIELIKKDVMIQFYKNNMHKVFEFNEKNICIHILSHYS